MTLKERMAAKKAAAEAPPSKGLVLASAEPPMSSEGLAATSMAKGRQLAYVDEGEHLPMLHEADGLSPGWSRLCHHYETELCIVIGPGIKDEAWLGIKAENQVLPLLIHKLPLVILPGSFSPY